MGRVGQGTRVLAGATALLLVLGLGVAALYPRLAASEAGMPFPPDALWRSVRVALPAYGLLAVGAWWAGGRRLAVWAAFLGTLLTLALGVALYAVALNVDSPTAPLRALRLVPLRQLVAAAITLYAVSLARRTSL